MAPTPEMRTPEGRALADRVRAAEALRDVAPGATVVVGASGGLDSTALLRLLVASGFRCVAAHVNVGLRGAASDADEAFVAALAAELGVPFEPTRVALETGNRQAAARRARLGWLEGVALHHASAVIAVGTTRDDQAESVLLGLLRGAGPRGMAGAAPARPLEPGDPIRLVRPLLGVGRAEIEAIARAEGWAWREDASNATDAYLRNRLRHHVLPALDAALGEPAAPRLAASAEALRAWLTLADLPPFDDLLARDGESLAVQTDALARLDRPTRLAVWHEAIHRLKPGAPPRRSLLDAIDALLGAQVGRRVERGGLVAWRERGAVRLEPAQSEASHGLDSDASWSVAMGGEAVTPWGVLHVGSPEPVPPAWPRDAYVAWVDPAALAQPLVLRPWRAGDRLVPLGMAGHKRVSDLLTDRRVPPSGRARQLVLEGARGIVWVVGHRLSEAARVPDGAAEAARLEWVPREGEGS